jgi:hypothetical protein
VPPQGDGPIEDLTVRGDQGESGVDGHATALTVLDKGSANRNVTVDGNIKSRHTANAVMKQAGVAFRF